MSLVTPLSASFSASPSVRISAFLTLDVLAESLVAFTPTAVSSAVICGITPPSFSMTTAVVAVLNAAPTCRFLPSPWIIPRLIRSFVAAIAQVGRAIPSAKSAYVFLIVTAGVGTNFAL